MPAGRRLRRRSRLLAAVMVAALAAIPAAAQAGPPAGFALQQIGPATPLPTAFAYAPDGRVFIAGKSGMVRVWDGTTMRTFLNLTAQVNAFSDRGLLGIALDPDFSENRWVYLAYTVELNPSSPDQLPPAGGRIIRVQAQATDPNAADTSTIQTVVDGFEATGPWHAVGGLRFDPERRLLASFGDGSPYYPASLGPATFSVYDLASLHGKIIRVDPDTGNGVPGNPWFNPNDPASNRSRIIARGFRNPFKFTIDPPTGRVWVGDVGTNRFEELNTFIPGQADAERSVNFGWPCYEGGDGVAAKQPGYAGNASTRDLCLAVYAADEGGTGPGSEAPVMAYPHTEPGGANGSSITAGPVYRGTSYPSGYVGDVFIADYARDRVQTYDPVSRIRSDFGPPGGWGNVVDIQIAPDGDVAILSIGTGRLHEIRATGANQPPRAVITANPSAGTPPLEVAFSSAGTTDPDAEDVLTYSWDFGDGNTSTAANPVHTYTRPGTYSARLTVRDGRPGGVAAAETLVEVGNRPPAIRFTSPAAADGYRVGDLLDVGLDASDPEDGALSGDSVTWSWIQHHIGHLHYNPDETGTSGTLAVPDHGDDSYIELVATARDSLGAETSTSLTLSPTTVPVTVVSRPEGAELNVDGTDVGTRYTWNSIVNGTHVVSVPASATLDGTSAGFRDWVTEAGVVSTSRTLGFRTPAAPVRYTARYDVPFPAGNLLPNPSFETDTRGWSTSRATVVSVTSPEARHGGRIARLTPAAGATTMYLAAVPAMTSDAGRTLRARLWLRAGGAASEGDMVTVWLRELTPARSLVAESAVRIPLSAEFQPVTLETVPQRTGGRFELRIARSSGVTPDEVVEVDRVSLAPGDPVPPGAVPAGNLLANPSVEPVMTPWIRSSATQASVAVPDAVDGLRAATVTATGTNPNYGIRQAAVVPATVAGRMYAARASVRTVPGDAPGRLVGVWVRELTPSGRIAREWLSRMPLGAAFAPLVVSAPASADGNALDIRVAQENAVGGDRFAADAISLRPE